MTQRKHVLEVLNAVGQKLKRFRMSNGFKKLHSYSHKVTELALEATEML